MVASLARAYPRALATGFHSNCSSRSGLSDRYPRLPPGFHGAPVQVFELFWSRRVVLQISGTVVPALDRVSTALVAGHEQVGVIARDYRAE